MTSEQLEVLADMLRLGAATRAGVRLVLIDGLTHQAAAQAPLGR